MGVPGPGNNLSCANVTATDNFLIHVLGSVGAVSITTSLVALCWLFYLKLYRQFLYRLAAYQVTASLLHAIIAISQFAFLNYDDSKRTSCVVVGYLYLVTVWMKSCFGCWITFHLFCFAVLLKNMRKLEPLYVVTSILFPIVVSSVPLVTSSYGPTGEWCWVEERKCDRATGFIEQIALWSGPAFVGLVLQSVALLTMMITVYYRAHRNSGYGRDQYRKAFKQLLPLVAYPVLFCILVTPPLIARVYGFAAVPNKGLLTLSAVCIPCWSLFAGVTLIAHIGVLRCADKPACMCVRRVVFSPSSRSESEIPRDSETTPMLKAQNGTTRT